MYPISMPSRRTRYAVTPSLSVPAFQANETEFAVEPVSRRFVGAVGGTVSVPSFGMIATPWVATPLTFANSPPKTSPSWEASMSQTPKKLSIGMCHAGSATPVFASIASDRMVASPMSPSWKPA